MQNPQFQTAPEPKRLDWTTMVVPFLLIIILCLCFLAAPDASKAVLENLRAFLGENFGVGYLTIGLGIFLLSIYIAFSRYGTIRLGKPDEKPLYSNFAWGSMMFTSGLAADILFYSLCEWVLYANDPHLAEMGSIQDWASTYPLFHWGPIPWGFYVVLAAAFGFMLHVRGCHKQKYSEACRPILGKHTDGLAGTLIDLMAVFALLAGTTTTFTLATPLMSQIVSELFGFSDTRLITIAILAVTCLVYTLFWRMCCCSAVKHAISSKPASPPSEIWYRTLSDCLPTPTRSAPPHFRRHGQCSTGHTGWSGASLPRSSLEPSLVGAPSGRQSSAATCSGLAARL